MQQDDWRKLTDDGVALLRQNQPHEASRLLRRAFRQAPDQKPVRYWLANACRKCGDNEEALALFRALLAEQPTDFDTAFAMAFLLRDMGRPADAAETLLGIANSGGESVDRLLQIAGFLRDSDQYDAATSVCEQAVGLQPERADLHFKLARLYQATGAFDRARISLRTNLRLNPSAGPAWSSLAQQQRFASDSDEDFQRIEDASTRSLGDEANMCVAFAFGKALDDLRRWPAAWAQYAKGNEMMSRAKPWNQSVWVRFVDRAIARNAVDRSPTPGSPRKGVFIVGMPRSGTTLLEQLLDRHPDIAGRGELNFLAHFARQSAQVSRLGEQQKQQMAETFWTQLRLDGPEDGFFVDKNPLNFRYLDLAFDLLPDARVLHVTRDGRDSCLSCFFQLFQHEDLAFSNDLEHLAAYYSDYRRLMTHWELTFPGRIMRVDYETLVRAGEDVLADLLGFIGAESKVGLTQIENHGGSVRSASIWQARQPVHTRSIGRWRHYEEHAPDFFARLAEIDSAFGVDKCRRDK